MSDTFESVLKKLMQSVGHVVESAIGGAKKARVQMTSRSGTLPILSLESRLNPTRLHELIEDSCLKVLQKDAIPDLKGGRALEVGEGPVSYGARMLAGRASMAIGVEIGGGSIGRQLDPSRGLVIRGEVARLPFRDGGFQFILARFATTFQGDMLRAIKEVGRLLTSGCQGIIVDYHPFGLYATKGADRVRQPDTGIHKVEDYYKLCRQSGLRIIDIRESYVDETVRSFFKEEEIGTYRGIKGTPLLIFLFVYKPKGG